MKHVLSCSSGDQSLVQSVCCCLPLRASRPIAQATMQPTRSDCNKIWVPQNSTNVPVFQNMNLANQKWVSVIPILSFFGKKVFTQRRPPITHVNFLSTKQDGFLTAAPLLQGQGAGCHGTSASMSLGI